jgi:hypothetical protein
MTVDGEDVGSHGGDMDATYYRADIENYRSEHSGGSGSWVSSTTV